MSATRAAIVCARARAFGLIRIGERHRGISVTRRLLVIARPHPRHGERDRDLDVVRL